MIKKLLTILALAFWLNTNAQIITTVAGNGYGAGTGMGGYSGDGGQATSAEIFEPSGIAFDAAGNYYISDNAYSFIRKVNTLGIISTIAGSYALGSGYSGDGGQATDAQLLYQLGIVCDASGNLYIVDAGNSLIRKVNTAGIITTVAGDTTGLYPMGYGYGYSGDGGQATNAKLNNPSTIAFDVAGNLYIADSGNNLIRKVTTAGIITTIAGDTTGVTNISCGHPCNAGYSGNGGIATSAKINTPYGVAVDATGNLFFSELSNNCIRMVNTAGIITTIAGNDTTPGFSGDGGAATAAEISYPNGISFDATGNLYIADYGNVRIRKINTAGIITTVAGDGALGYTGDGGLATSATLNNPVAVAFDAAANLYIADQYNNVIREVNFSFITPVPDICMVSTDSTTNYNYNIIYWDNTYPSADSFIVYRKDAVSSTYLRIGAVSATAALSNFTDTLFTIGGPNGGNPQYSSWLYKLAIHDIYGNIGAMSPYHQTMFIQENNSNFSWNAYTVETGQTNPVTGYSFLRDDNNNGNWNVLVNTSALSTTDPNYASYPNGNWRVDALGFNCPTTNIKARSNTTRLVATGIKQLTGINNQIAIYPNPNNGSFIIEPSSTTKQTMQVYDVNSKLVLSQTINGKSSIDAGSLNEGVYNISLQSNEGVVNKRVVIVR